MPSLTRYPEIKETDRAYFAGLFDGEGTVGVHKVPKKNRGAGYSLRVAFKITYKSILIRMQKCFGGNIYIHDLEKHKNCKSSKMRIEYTNANPDKWKQQYVYLLSGKDALYFLKVIEPFCDEKKQQVSLGIRYEQGRRPHAGGFGSERSERETERCEFFHQELKKLKKEQPTENELKDESDFEDGQQNLFSFVEEV